MQIDPFPTQICAAANTYNLKDYIISALQLNSSCGG